MTGLLSTFHSKYCVKSLKPFWRSYMTPSRRDTFLYRIQFQPTFTVWKLASLKSNQRNSLWNPVADWEKDPHCQNIIFFLSSASLYSSCGWLPYSWKIFGRINFDKNWANLMGRLRLIRNERQCGSTVELFIKSDSWGDIFGLKEWRTN